MKLSTATIQKCNKMSWLISWLLPLAKLGQKNGLNLVSTLILSVWVNKPLYEKQSIAVIMWYIFFLQKSSVYWAINVKQDDKFAKWVEMLQLLRKTHHCHD